MSFVKAKVAALLISRSPAHGTLEHDSISLITVQISTCLARPTINYRCEMGDVVIRVKIEKSTAF